MDEGWTRLMLEMFSFPYDTLMDARITQGDLNDDYDVIVLPADGVAGMTGERQEDGSGFSGGDDDESIPPDYRSGFGRCIWTESGAEAGLWTRRGRPAMLAVCQCHCLAGMMRRPQTEIKNGKRKKPKRSGRFSQSHPQE